MMKRILFIGNSHTYLHYMPQILAELARQREQSIFTEQLTGEGAGLEWHWNRPETRDRIDKGPWTHVVLQERSRGPLEETATMRRHAVHLDHAIRHGNAKTVFYMTWAARGNPTDQAVITRAYRDIALECGAMLAPVGTAWELARQHSACPDLYHKDGRHAGKAGAYLSACVFYALLCEDSPVGLSGLVEKEGRLLASFPDDTALLLQEAARCAVEKYGIA